MTRPADSADHPDQGALREVQDAYRALPPAEPGAALDARVRAAVAAELAAAGVADTAAPAASAKVIEFPWWRRASMPLAAAATLMLAVGLGRMWFVEGMSERAPDSPYQAPAPERKAAPAAEAPAAPAAAEPRVSNAQQQGAKPSAAPKQRIADAPPAAKAAPQKSDSAAADDAVIFRGLERAAPPPPPAEAEAKREAAPQADNARRERSAESLNAAPAPAPAVAPAAKPAASEAPAAKAMQKRAADSALPDDASTFEEVRRLLRDQRRDDARALLKRWRDAHPGVTLPDDLRALAAEPDRAP